jgi:hypothetical protein
MSLHGDKMSLFHDKISLNDDTHVAAVLQVRKAALCRPLIRLPTASCSPIGATEANEGVLWTTHAWDDREARATTAEMRDA